MLAQGQTVIQLMEQLAPKHYAVENDKIGLQLGTLQKEISHVLIALDVTDAVVDEAIAAGVDLIIAHHAIIYRPLAKLDTSTPAGRLYEKLIKHDIAVYISHTNLDVAEDGMNDWMADLIGITANARTSLEEVYTEKMYKLAVYVPETHLESVREALWKAGAGAIGNYDQCSFGAPGVGTFRPGAAAQPFIGTQGHLEKVQEVKLEVIVPERASRKSVQAMLKAHPYEEVAYDLIQLEQQGRSLGLGRAGKLMEPVTLQQLVETVKTAFEVPYVRVVGDLNRVVKKAAVLGGSGARYYRHALFAGADVLVTGDIDYHTAHDALMAGICLIDPGHNAEKIMKVRVAQWLSKRLADSKYGTKVTDSSVNTEPFQFL